MRMVPGDEGESEPDPADDVGPAHREGRPLADVLRPDRVEVQARVQDLRILLLSQKSTVLFPKYHVIHCDPRTFSIS